MAVSSTLTRVDRPGAGAFAIEFDGSSTLECDDLTALQNYAASTPADDKEATKINLIRWWLYRDPTAANDNLVEGKVCTFDVAQASAIMWVS